MSRSLEAREFGYRMGLVCRRHRCRLSDDFLTDLAAQYVVAHRNAALEAFLTGYEDAFTDHPEYQFA